MRLSTKLNDTQRSYNILFDDDVEITDVKFQSDTAFLVLARVDGKLLLIPSIVTILIVFR